MLYEEVFDDDLPAEWCTIAQLETIQQTASFSTVEFYLIDHSQEAKMRAALADYGPTLPAASRVSVFSCD